jgi:hypothetical protein
MVEESSADRDAPRYWALALTGATGLVIWIATMARYPHESNGAHESRGSAALFPLLAAAAFVGGLLEPRRPRVVAACTIAGPLALAYWTTPRGDGDGMWGLIFPILGAFALFLAWCAGVAGQLIHRRR